MLKFFSALLLAAMFIGCSESAPVEEANATVEANVTEEAPVMEEANVTEEAPVMEEANATAAQ